MSTALLAVSVVGNIILLWLLLMVVGSRQYFQIMREDEQADGIRRPRFRRFVGNRYEDVTGISGNGIRVEGVVFSDGWGVTHWLDLPPMNEPKTEVWHKPWWRRRSPDPFTKISGHGGKTVVEWLDTV